MSVRYVLISDLLHVQAWVWSQAVDWNVNWLSDYFAKQVMTPNPYGQGPTLSLEEQIKQKAETGQAPMGLFPEGVKQEHAV